LLQSVCTIISRWYKPCILYKVLLLLRNCPLPTLISYCF